MYHMIFEGTTTEGTELYLKTNALSHGLGIGYQADMLYYKQAF